MKIFIILALFSFQVFSNDVYEIGEEERSPESEEVLVNKPEKYLLHESMIYDFNTELGIKDQRQYTGSDNGRFMASLHLSGQYEHLSELLGFEINYLAKTSSYDHIWWGFQLFQHNTYFKTITQNPTSGGSGSDSTYVRDNSVKNKILGFGPGLGYRFKLLLDFFPTEDTFETIDVFFNGLFLEESFIEERYQGYGISTSYGLHKRTRTSYFYGAKFSYHLGNVTRRQIESESEGERTLTLGWLSLAFNVGFFL